MPLSQDQIDQILPLAQKMTDAAKGVGQAESDKEASDLQLAASQADNQAKANAVAAAEQAFLQAETDFESLIETIKTAF